MARARPDPARSQLSTPILLVATATRWLAAARMPKPLSRAGFEVALLAPRNSLAEHSRYIAKVGYLPEQATPAAWVQAFAAAVAATRPRLVMPCDDVAFRLLQMLALSPPPSLRPAEELKALIIESLGDPAWYRASVEKTLLPAAAELLGIPVPPFVVTTEVPEAQRFAAARGYPIVLKRAHSSAADGVRICDDARSVAAAFVELLRPRPADFDGTPNRILVQAHVDGPKNYPVMTWKGDVLTGYAAEKLVTNPPVTGPSTVTRYHADESIRQLAIKIARGFGTSGFLALECVIDRRTGQPYLLEINRRLVPGGHRGSDFGVDHCLALHAALRGEPPATRAGFGPGEDHISVHFPQEWLRDPGSAWLRSHPVDVPWDEPELLEAMLALRHV